MIPHRPLTLFSSLLWTCLYIQCLYSLERYLVINGSALMQSLVIIIHYFVVILLTGQMFWFLQLKSLTPQLSLLANPTHSTSSYPTLTPALYHLHNSGFTNSPNSMWWHQEHIMTQVPLCWKCRAVSNICSMQGQETQSWACSITALSCHTPPLWEWDPCWNMQSQCETLTW